MEYRVEELAAAAGIGVDTVRFYQGKGLLPSPRRAGRVAVYGETHLKRLRHIRSLLRNGLSLALIKRVLETPTGEKNREPLLQALVAETVGERTFSRSELAREAGIPEALIQAASEAGLVEPLRVAGAERFTQADLEMARAGLALLETGFPLAELLQLAMAHARVIQDSAEKAVDLFERHLRKGEQGSIEPEAASAAFRRLLPEATRLVALHFQRTGVNHALRRLAGAGEEETLAAALAATESARLEISWK